MEAMDTVAARSKLVRWYAPTHEENQQRGVIAKRRCARIFIDDMGIETRCHGTMVMRKVWNTPIAQTEMHYIVYCQECGTWYETHSVPKDIIEPSLKVTTDTVLKGSN